jgi:hypothetical protein
MTSIPFYTRAIEPGAIRPRVAPRAVQAARDAALKLAGVCAALLAAAGFLLQPPEAAAPSAPASVRSGWVEIARPAPLFSLAAPQLAREKTLYAARRHEGGGGREDSLTVGDFGGGRAFLRLSVYRHGAEKAADAPFYVEMARRAAPLGLSIVRASLEQVQPTRFGPLETAALSLSQGESARGDCRGFRLVQDQPALTIAGLACPGGQEVWSPADLACLVDRLDWIGSTDEPALRAFFAAKPARAVGCGKVAATDPAPAATKRGRRR